MSDYGAKFWANSTHVSLDGRYKVYYEVDTVTAIARKPSASALLTGSTAKFWFYTHYADVYSPYGWPVASIVPPLNYKLSGTQLVPKWTDAHDSAQGVAVTGVAPHPTNGSGWYRAYIISTNNYSGSIAVRFHAPLPTTPVNDGWGMRLYDSSGRLTFDSARQVLQYDRIKTLTLQPAWPAASDGRPSTGYTAPVPYSTYTPVNTEPGGLGEAFWLTGYTRPVFFRGSYTNNNSRYVWAYVFYVDLPGPSNTYQYRLRGVWARFLWAGGLYTGTSYVYGDPNAYTRTFFLRSL